MSGGRYGLANAGQPLLHDYHSSDHPQSPRGGNNNSSRTTNSFERDADVNNPSWYWGRPRSLVVGSIVGTTFALPLIVAIIKVVSAYEVNDSLSNSVELACSIGALFASGIYLYQTFKNRQQNFNLRVFKNGFSNNFEMTSFVLLPLTLYGCVSMVAQVTIMVHAVQGYHLDREQGMSNATECALSYREELDSSVVTLLIIQSIFYMFNVLLIYVNVTLHIIGYRSISKQAWPLFVTGCCLGYLFAFNFLEFIIDINNTWSTGVSSYDNMVVTAYITYHFFTACVFFNMAYLQKLTIHNNLVSFTTTYTPVFDDLPEMTRAKRPVNNAA